MLDPQNARQQLEQILSEREYTIYYEDTQGIFSRVLNAIINWIVELISRLFPNFEQVASGNEFLIFGIVVAVVIALMIGCIFMVRSIQRKRRFRDSKPLEVLTETEWTYEMHEKKAYELESSGDYSQATRHLFLAILLFFDKRGWLVAKRWKTNWEYYDELVRTDKNRAERFFDFALLFDRATYGSHDVSESEYSRFKEEAMTMLMDGNRQVDEE